MKKPRKILFPTDFSNSAINAFRYTLLLADKMQASVEVINVVYPEPEPLDFPVLVAQATQRRLELSKEQLNQFVEIGMTQTLQQLENAPDIYSKIEIGTPSVVIANNAERVEADLIIMGTKGMRNGIEKIVGSVAAGVVKRAHCPVLVVPENATELKLNKVAYATDFNEADPFEIWKMMNLLKLESPTVRCIHCEKENQDGPVKMMEYMENFFIEKRPNLSIHFQSISCDNIIQGINDFLDEYNIQLLVMYQPHRTFFEKLFHHSTTKEMALKSHVPLLVMKA